MLGHKSNTSHLHDSVALLVNIVVQTHLQNRPQNQTTFENVDVAFLTTWVLETRITPDNVGTFFRGCPMMFLPWCTLRIRCSSQENLCLQSLGSQGSSSCSSHSTDRRRRTFVLPRLTALFCGSILLLPHATEVIIPHLRIGFSYPEKTTATTYAAQWPFRLFRQTTTWRIQ
jgi:hypothetical protein